LLQRLPDLLDRVLDLLASPTIVRRILKLLRKVAGASKILQSLFQTADVPNGATRLKANSFNLQSHRHYLS
jgi:hypothetical protein